MPSSLPPLRHPTFNSAPPLFTLRGAATAHYLGIRYCWHTGNRSSGHQSSIRLQSAVGVDAHDIHSSPFVCVFVESTRAVYQVMCREMGLPAISSRPMKVLKSRLPDRFPNALRDMALQATLSLGYIDRLIDFGWWLLGCSI